VEAGRCGVAKISCPSLESNPGSPVSTALLYRLNSTGSITKEAYVRKFVRTHFGSVENIVASRVGIRDSNIRRDSFLHLRTPLLPCVTNNEVSQCLMNILAGNRTFLSPTVCPMDPYSIAPILMFDTVRQTCPKTYNIKLHEDR
jgi:hypothetical protein